jgi:hypothetical protein
VAKGALATRIEIEFNRTRDGAEQDEVGAGRGTIMIAPVYRNLDTKNTIAGLGLVEFLLFLLATYGLLILASARAQIVGIPSVYVGLLLALRRRPAGFLQHGASYLWRRLSAAGRLSAAARASPRPQFPFGPYLCRDVPLLNSKSERPNG